MVRYLTEKQRIEILIMRGCGDRQRTQEEVCVLFNMSYPNQEPIVRSTVSKIERNFFESAHRLLGAIYDTTNMCLKKYN